MRESLIKYLLFSKEVSLTHSRYTLLNQQLIINSHNLLHLITPSFLTDEKSDAQQT